MKPFGHLSVRILLLALFASLLISAPASAQDVAPTDYPMISPENVADLQVIYQLPQGDGESPVMPPVWVPDSRSIIANQGQVMSLWDLTGETSPIVLEELEYPIIRGGAAFSADGTMLATVVDSQQIRIRTWPDLQEIALLDAPQPPGYLKFSPDGRYLGAMSGQILPEDEERQYSNQVAIWDVTTQAFVGTVGYEPPTGIEDYTFGNEAEVITLLRRRLHHWEIAQIGEYIDPLLGSKQEMIDNAVLGEAIADDTRPIYEYIAFTNEESDIALWLINEFDEAFFSYADGTYEEVAPFDSGEEHDEDGIPQMLNGFTRLERGERIGLTIDLQLLRFGSPTGPVAPVGRRQMGSVLPIYEYDAEADTITELETGRIYTAVEVDGTGQFIDDAGEALYFLPYYYGDPTVPDVVELAGRDTIFSPDGRAIANINRDDQLVIVDPITGETTVAIAEIETEWLRPGQFNPDANLLITPGPEDALPTRFWDLTSGTVVHTWEDTAFRDVSISPDGQLLLVNTTEGDVIVYAVQ